jgi:tetratricopeptide (TPR) repeat protein
MRRLLLLLIIAWPDARLAFARGDEGAPAPAAASSPAGGEAGVEPSAQAHIDAGVKAYQEGRFRDAVESFKEADRLAPSARLSFNIAKVYERMGDNRSALAAYRDYLRRLPAADNEAEVSQRVAELERALAAIGVQQLSVLSTPAGATVAIDDVSRGVTPWTGELAPGVHQVSLRLDGYTEATRPVELPADHAIDVELALTRAPTPVAAAVPAPPRESTPPIGVPRAGAGLEEAPQAEARVPEWWTWSLFGGSAAALLGAGILELSRRDLEDQARHTQVQVERQDKSESMESRQTAARVVVGVGVVAALAGAVSLYFDLERAEQAPTLAFDCTPSGCSMGAGGRF